MALPERVCITGGSGFMGRHLARRLLTAGRRVTVLDLAPLPADLLAGGARLVQGSVTDPAAVAAALEGAGAVVHLAAKVSDYGAAADFTRLNVEATRVVAAEARRADVARLVHMSSVAVFDYRRGFRDADEETPAGGHEYAYGQTKHEAEAAVRAAGLPAVIVRPALVPYGPEDLLTVGTMFRAVERGVPLLVRGGRALLGTSYIDNLIDGLLLCLEHPAAVGHTFHITDDVQISWRDWIQAIARALGVRPNLRSTPRWLAYPAAATLEGLWRLLGRRQPPPLTRYRVRTATSDLHFSSQKARRLLGYAPRVDLEEGLRRATAWYRSRGAVA